MRRVAAMVAVVVLGALGTACSSDQDPGLTPEGSTGGPTTTSHLLQACPPGGPDATTPSEGCLGPDGKVLLP